MTLFRALPAVGGGKELRRFPAAGRSRFLALLVFCVFVGCRDPYRVGERVMVEWEDKDYPAYILELRTRGRFKVHMDGYDTRWDRIVDAEQIKGRAEGTVPAPPPPKRVARAMGLTPAASAQAKSAVSTFKVGHKVKVKWRGSTYSATIVEVVAPDKYKIHYNGHESAWDEVVPLERIQGR